MFVSHKAKNHVTPPDGNPELALRDSWLCENGTWNKIESSVMWEELEEARGNIKEGILVSLFRRCSGEYRRRAEAEAILQKEAFQTRQATTDYEYDPPGRAGDESLIMSIPHATQPVILEDNQATIRIMESGRSPAFRRADKTQRVNLSWLSEQFKRKHYTIASINTALQVADILTKPFTSSEKWSHALRLLAHTNIPEPARSRKTRAEGSAAPASRPENSVDRVLVEVCCSSDSLMGTCDAQVSEGCKVIRITQDDDLNSPATRRHVAKELKKYHELGKPIFIWASLPCTGGTSWSHINLKVPGAREKVLEHRKMFLKL
jgi:hypothetical protein